MRKDLVLMKSEGSGGAAAAVRRRRTRWRVQADAAAPAPLQRLLAACRGTFGGPAVTVPARADVARIRGILDKIGPEDVHLSAKHKVFKASTDTSGPQRHPVIVRTTIYECRNFSIVIFFLPPCAVIPLHNHPGMTVFSKLLLGSLHVTSYDWADPAVAAVVSAPDDHPLRLARLVLDADLRAPCDALVLYPESGGNMHRFTAATPCAVLDVLGPPYSESENRDCTYYQDFPYSHHDPDEIADITAEQKKRLGWLKETAKPKDLEMYEVPYKGPPIV